MPLFISRFKSEHSDKIGCRTSPRQERYMRRCLEGSQQRRIPDR